MTDLIYRSLQVVIIHPYDHCGEMITLQGEGKHRPYNYNNSLNKAIGTSQMMSTLYVSTSKRIGMFVLSDLKINRASPNTEPKQQDNELNYIANAVLGLKIYGSIVFASAERCGDNQYLYNLGPICPQEVSNFIRTGRVPRFLMPAVKQSTSNDASSIMHSRQLDFGVAVSVDEAWREWWESFSEAKTASIKNVSEEAWQNTSEPLREFLKGVVAVWCSECGAKYRRLSLCRGCQCVAFCSQGCWKVGFVKHESICNLLAGK